MTYSTLINTLKEYFIKRGFQILVREETTIPQDLLEHVDLLFRDANNVIAVKAVTDILEKEQFLASLTKATVLREYVDKVYIATSTKYKPFINGRLLSSNGVGLLLIDEEGNVQEAIPPRPTTRRTLRGIPKEYIDELRSLKEQINELRKGYSDLIKEIERFREIASEVRELHNRILRLEQRLRGETVSLGKIEKVEESLETISIPNKEELPSYLRDNPWLQVLSRRGKGR